MAEITTNLKQAICSLFEVHSDDGGVQRVVTPLEYPGCNDQVVIRVRPVHGGFSIDENGESAFYASLNGGDIEADAVERWAAELLAPVKFTEDEVIEAFTNDERLVASYVFRVAEAAQQLHAIAISCVERQINDFRDRIKAVVQEIADALHVDVESNVELPIAGGLKADHVLSTKTPLIIVTATSATRLLEAEVIFMQYRSEKKPGYVLAIAEDQQSVGKKQYERANYYTDKTVIFNPDSLRQLVAQIN
jgi:hypothetical protein